MRYVLFLGFFASLCLLAQAGAAEQKPALWLYCPTNLQVDANVDQLDALWTRAAKAGYTQVMLTDSKFSRLDDVPANYFKNCERVKQIAARLHLQIVPSLFPIGYSNNLLFKDPNLAEGLAVKDSLFEVKGGEARLVADPPVKLEKISFQDESVKVADGIATVHPGKEVSRFVYNVPVSPHRCYHVSVKIRTKDLEGEPEVKVLGGPWTLNWANLGVKPTQEWTEHHAIFNSLDNKEVRVYFGIWNDPRGQLQWKDWKIEEVGLLNVLRRDGTPLSVKEDRTGKEFHEGADYQPIADPHLGNTPWPGEYQVWHEPPVIHTRLPDGARLRVSWYHPVIIHDEQVAACISEPKTMELLADQAARMKKLWESPLYMMEHDEFRTLNWDESCQKRHLTPGQMLAENVKQCTDLLRPNRAAVWSDMFDPFHNAVKGPYYLVNGPWTGSWEGVDKSVLIMNWNYGKRDQSLKFFADRGNEQVIAGYYDNDLAEWKNWLASAGKVKGVVGYMYTTWHRNYSKIEQFAQMTRPN